MEFVNIVNYKIYMDKDKIKNNEIEAQIIVKKIWTNTIAEEFICETIIAIGVQVD